MTITAAGLSRLIDHTLLSPDASKEQFAALCGDAVEYGFAMVAVNPYPVALCAELVKGTSVHVGAAIAFPLGQTTIRDKVSETARAIGVNLVELKDGNLSYVREEMERIVAVCREAGAVSKVIFENCYLDEEEKRALAGIAAEVRPDFVKTSTGFGPGGATLDDVKLMKDVVGDGVGVKAAGGIRDLDAALAFLDAGATRLGTSRGPSLVDQLRARSQG